jgi:TolB-like protein/predicted Zn-dependent protease
MKDSSPVSSSGPTTQSLSDQPSETALDSWKEIAAYVKRDVSTVQRWEKREGMPVHRHVHDKRGSVYAFPSELDAWLQSRKLRLEEEQKAQEAETSVGAEASSGPRESSLTRRWLVLGAAAALALLGIAYVLNRNRGGVTVPPKIKSLAVLPLKNLSGDPAQEYFADGITEAVIGRLSMIRGLRVISRTSVMGFRDTRMTAPEIAKALRVDALVEGSVIREGGRVRVHAQLIRGATDEHFWSETYDRELGDSLALESDVAQSIARRVEVTVTGEERARLVAAPHVSPEVYESYLKGRFARGNTRAEREKSVAYFEDAIRKDPTFAPAYVGLAGAYSSLATVFGGSRPDEQRPKAVSAARMALQLDPNLPEAHAVLAGLYMEQYQWREAEAEYKRALELKPSDAAAHFGYASWLLCQGRTEEALSWARRARELDPLGISGTDLAWILFQARHYDDAIRELRSMLGVHPDSALTYWFLGFALAANNQADEAITSLQKAYSLSGHSPAVMGVLVRAYAHAGRRTEALRALDQLKRRQLTGYVPAGAFVNAYLGLGDQEQALVWLERGYQEHSNILKFLKVHPFFDPLRDDPRFKDLVHRVGLD